MRILLLALLALHPLSAGAAGIVRFSAGAQGQPAGFPAVGAPWAQSMAVLLRGISPGGMPRLVRELQTMDLSAPKVRSALDPLVSQLVAMGYTQAKLERMDPITARVIVGMAATGAQKAVAASAKSLIDAASAEKAGPTSLSETAAGLEKLTSAYALYLDAPLRQDAVKAQETARTRLSAMGSDAVEKEILAVAEGLARSNAEDGVMSSEDNKTAAALGLLDSLSKSHSLKRVLRLQRRLEKLASRSSDPALRELVVRGILKDARSRDFWTDNWTMEYGMEALDAARRLAELGGERIEAAAVAGMMDAFSDHKHFGHTGTLEAVEAIASRSPSRAVKSLAVGYLARLVPTEGNEDNRKNYETAMARIAASDSGRTPVAAVPALKAAPALKPAGWPGFLWQTEKALWEHPVAAFFTALSLMGSIITSAKLGFPALGLALFGTIALYAAARGIFRAHPWATFFQLGMLGHFMEIVADKATLTPGTVAGFGVAAAVWAGVALLSFKSHNPKLGWLVNLVVLAVLLPLISDLPWQEFFTYTIRFK